MPLVLHAPTLDEAAAIEVLGLFGRQEEHVRAGNPIRIHILSSFDINAICWTGSRAQKASNTLLQTILVAMQNVDPTVARLKMNGLVWIILRNCFTKHISEGYAETLHQRAKCLAHFPNDRCHTFSLAKG